MHGRRATRFYSGDCRRDVKKALGLEVFKSMTAVLRSEDIRVVENVASHVIIR